MRDDPSPCAANGASAAPKSRVSKGDEIPQAEPKPQDLAQLLTDLGTLDLTSLDDLPLSSLDDLGLPPLTV